MKKEEKQLPNQFLADRIAGKVDEKGNPIELENKEEETTDETNHVLTKEDVDANPELEEAGLKAGDEIELGASADSNEPENDASPSDASNEPEKGIDTSNEPEKGIDTSNEPENSALESQKEEEKAKDVE